MLRTTFTETERINAAQRRFTAALDTVLDRAREEMGNYQWVGFEIARRNAFLQMLDRRIRKEFGTLLAVAPHGVEPASWAERAAQDIVTNKLTNWLHDPDTSSLLAPLLGGPAAEVMTDLRRRLGELIRSLYDEVVLISIPSRTEERPPALAPEEPVALQPAPEPADPRLLAPEPALSEPEVTFRPKQPEPEPQLQEEQPPSPAGPEKPVSVQPVPEPRKARPVMPKYRNKLKPAIEAAWRKFGANAEYWMICREVDEQGVDEEEFPWPSHGDQKGLEARYNGPNGGKVATYLSKIKHQLIKAKLL